MFERGEIEPQAHEWLELDDQSGVDPGRSRRKVAISQPRRCTSDQPSETAANPRSECLAAGQEGTPEARDSRQRVDAAKRPVPRMTTAGSVGSSSLRDTRSGVVDDAPSDAPARPPRRP